MAKSIPVLIDGYALSDGSQRRGIGTYLKSVAAGLAARTEFSVKMLADPNVKLPPEVQRIAVQARLPARLRTWEHDLRLPSEIRRHGLGVFHSPAQSPPRHSSVPWVQTLHDLTPLTRPHPILARDRRRWMRVGPRLRSATAVVAVSRFAADQGIRHLGLDPQRIVVIPHGVDHSVFRPDGPVEQREPPFLLHVAAWGPNKGFEEALLVIARLAHEGFPHRLVLAGPQDSWMLGRIETAVASSPCPERVDVAGYVEDLPSLYRGAAALLMTSRCEGFGLPALEAMACGTPVVAFDNSSLPEVLGEGGVMVPDGDVIAMTGSLRALLVDEDLRAETVRRGLAWAGRFSWEAAIESHAEVLRAAAE